MKYWQAIIKPGRLGDFVAVLFGALYPLAFSPIDWWPMSLISMVGFVLIVLRKELTPLQMAIRGWFYGLGYFGVGISWLYVSMHDYGYTPAILAYPMTGLFIAFMAWAVFFFFGYIYRYFRLDLALPIAFPALWILSEWIKTWVLTGFPWLFTGYGFIDTPLAGYAPIMGVFSVTWAAATSVALLVWMLNKPRNNVLIGAVCIAVIWLVGFFSVRYDWTEQHHDQTLKVSLIQSNISQDQKWLPQQLKPTKDLFRDFTLNEWQDKDWDADIIVWPEAAIPQFFHEGWQYFDEMSKLAEENQSTIITGVPTMEKDQSKYHFFNSIISMGAQKGMYHKQKLVPFGEYIPMEDLIRGLIPFFDLPMSSFTEGDPNQGPLPAGSYRLAPFICYEIVYPDFVINYARNAEFLITISNDAWFGESFGPHQHFQMTRMRAVETGRYLIRGTNNGITALVDHKGKVITEAPQFERLTLRGEVVPSTGLTPFMIIGSTPLIIYCIVVVAWCGYRQRKLGDRDTKEMSAEAA